MKKQIICEAMGIPTHRPVIAGLWGKYSPSELSGEIYNFSKENRVPIESVRAYTNGETECIILECLVPISGQELNDIIENKGAK